MFGDAGDKKENKQTSSVLQSGIKRLSPTAPMPTLNIRVKIFDFHDHLINSQMLYNLLNTEGYMQLQLNHPWMVLFI